MVKEEVKPLSPVTPTRIAPRIVYDEAMKEREMIHNTCTFILDIGIKEPFVQVFCSFNIRILMENQLQSTHFQCSCTKRNQAIVAKGYSEVKYLCECFGRYTDKVTYDLL